MCAQLSGHWCPLRGGGALSPGKKKPRLVPGLQVTRWGYRSMIIASRYTSAIRAALPPSDSSMVKSSSHIRAPHMGAYQQGSD